MRKPSSPGTPGERRAAAGGSGRGPHHRRASGELEAEVLAALWAAGQPLTASEVQAELSDQLAYTTVVTILTRLHEKDVLRREKHGRAYAYSPTEDESGLAARRMRDVLDAERDRGTVLARFVSELSRADESLLRGLLQPARRGHGRSGLR